MALRKDPKADLKRQYPLMMQIGLVLSLGLVILAFTADLPDPEGPEVMTDDTEMIELEEIEQTQQIQPPPPPPPAPPPPQEVPDDVEIEEDVIEDIELDLTAAVPPPATPPAQAAPTPPPPGEPPPPPPPEPEPTEPEIFEVAEVQPELIGGLEELQRNVEYPDFARRAGIEGRVIIQFVVDERGNVVDPVVARSPNDALSEAALEAVRQAKFRPGQQRGRPVKVRFSLPVTFRLR
jgi:protein TonB